MDYVRISSIADPLFVDMHRLIGNVFPPEEMLAFEYVPPSWDREGKAVQGLDFCFRPSSDELASLSAELVSAFLRDYYSALPNKPAEWNDMMTALETRGEIPLLPL